MPLVIGADVERTYYIGMVDPAGQPNLTAKARPGCVLGDHVGVQKLDRDPLTEDDVARPEHPAHRPAPELLAHLVAAHEETATPSHTR